MTKHTLAALLAVPLAAPAFAQRETPPAAATVALPDAGGKPPLVINIPGLPAGTQPPVELKPIDPGPSPAPIVSAQPSPAAAQPAPAAQAASPQTQTPAAPVALAAAPSKNPSLPPGPTVAMAMPAAPPAIWPPQPAGTAVPPAATAAKIPVAPAPVPVAPAPASVAPAAPAPSAPEPQLPDDFTGLTPPAQPPHPWVKIDSVEKLARDLQDVVTFLDRGSAYIAAYRKVAGSQESPRFKSFMQAYAAEKAIGRQEAETLRRWFAERPASRNSKP